MQYTRLGPSDLTVSRICLGCMGLGDANNSQHRWTVDEAHSREILRRALDLGINFFDTAIGYQNGTSEAYVGRALRGFARRGALDIEVYPAGDMTAPDYAAEIWVPVARIPDEGCGGRISPSLSSNPPFLHGTVGFCLPPSRLLS